MKMSYRKMKLEEIGKIVSGATPKTSTQDNFGGDIAWITPADLSGYTKKYISHGKRNITEMGYNSCSTQLMPKGSVLFSSRAPIGYVAIAENPLCTNQGFKSIVPNDLIDSEFLYYQLKYLSKSIQDKGTGTTFKEISAKTLGKIEIVVSLLSEQKNIVSRIEELFSKLDKGVETLQTIKQQLAVYRQAVYSSNFNKIGDFRPIVDFFEISGGLTKNSKRQELPQQVPYLRVANVYYNCLELDVIKTIGVTEKELQKCSLKTSDLLFVEGNGSKSQIGRVAMWDGSIETCVHQNHLIRGRANGKILPKYALYYLISQEGRKQIVDIAKSTSGLYTLSINKVKNLQIPFCSRPEQETILNEIEARLSVCDSIEQTVDEALAQADAMRQSILKQAFEGEI